RIGAEDGPTYWSVYHNIKDDEEDEIKCSSIHSIVRLAIDIKILRQRDVRFFCKL
uniref:Uncharacterized protein n=1 Tax=Physcomitrium patens TaxID=3218 RepID=A0A7I4CZW3_PHYPA